MSKLKASCNSGFLCSYILSWNMLLNMTRDWLQPMWKLCRSLPHIYRNLPASNTISESENLLLCTCFNFTFLAHLQFTRCSGISLLACLYVYFILFTKKNALNKVIWDIYLFPCWVTNQTRDSQQIFIIFLSTSDNKEKLHVNKGINESMLCAT